MEPIDFGYSMKNIPIASRQRYKLKLTEKVESVLKRMRWKALFFDERNRDQNSQNEENPQDEDEKIFRFKSRNCPKQPADMKRFESDVADLIKDIKFRRINSRFQQRLQTDVRRIQESKNIFVSADKTQNFYEVTKENYDRLLLQNVTKTYRKSERDLPDKINREAKKIAKSYKIDDKLDQINEQQCFITVKDHKEDFRTNPKYRLINPTKSEMGKLSKSILDKVNKNLKDLLMLNQWKDKDAVIDWFKGIENKSNCTFVVFDIEEFYPSISEKLLKDSITYAENHIEMSAKEKEVLFHCRRSLLFHNDEPWIKSKGNKDFDVTMGSNDGAEICELVGLYLLSLIAEKYRKEDTGLYRDDGLAIIRSRNGRQADVYRKNITKIMKDNGLKIEVKCNLKSVDYLDITFNLENGTYRPFKKPNNNPRYVHIESNHPQNITKQIPKSISKRISTNSSSEAIFDDAAPYYNDRLREAGYPEEIQYTDEIRNTQDRTRSRNRKRNVIWFNPPFCKSVETNVGRTFLRLVDKHFPRTHKYHKIFNRNTLKVSYSCMDNMENIIKQHNRKVVKPIAAEEERMCDCQRPEDCPLDGKCLTTNVNYSAVVTHSERRENTVKKTYIGVTEPQWKKRYRVHQHTFNNRGTPNDTSLSKYIWELKDRGIEYNIKWSILKRAPGYRKSSKTCGLCLMEKVLICEFPDKVNLLNDKSELVSKCRHSNKHLLKNCKPD